MEKDVRGLKEKASGVWRKTSTLMKFNGGGGGGDKGAASDKAMV